MKYRKRFLALACFFILAWAISPVYGQIRDSQPVSDTNFSDSDLSDLDEGGDDPFSDADLIPAETKVSADQATSPFHLGGYMEISSDIGFNKSNNKLSSLKPLLSLESEFKPGAAHKLLAGIRASVEASYALTDRTDPGPQSQDDREWELQPWDIYLDSRLSDHFSIRAGNQTIAWGESNYARVLDVINPRDMTRPGLMELEDTRMPIPAVRLTAQAGCYSAEAVTIHGNPGDRISGLDSDFDAFAALRSPGVRILNKENTPFSISPLGAGVKLTRSFNGGDLTLMASRTHDPSPVLSYRGMSFPGELTFAPTFEKMTTLGACVTLARDAALFKLETAFRPDRTVQRKDIPDQIIAGVPRSRVRSFEDRDQVEVLAGLEYSKISNLRIMAEGSWQRTLAHEDFLVTSRDLYTSYLQATYDLWHDTISLDLFWVYFNPGNGHILRMSGKYDITDNLRLKAGIAFYDAETLEAKVYPYQDMDRLFLIVTYFF